MLFIFYYSLSLILVDNYSSVCEHNPMTRQQSWLHICVSLINKVAVSNFLELHSRRAVIAHDTRNRVCVYVHACVHVQAAEADLLADPGFKPPWILSSRFSSLKRPVSSAAFSKPAEETVLLPGKYFHGAP